MRVKLTSTNGYVYFKLSGTLRKEDYPKLRQVIQNFLSQDTRKIILDLNAVHHLHYLWATYLDELYNYAKSLGYELQLHCRNGYLINILRFGGYVHPIYP